MSWHSKGQSLLSGIISNTTNQSKVAIHNDQCTGDECVQELLAIPAWISLLTFNISMKEQEEREREGNRRLVAALQRGQADVAVDPDQR